jgi:NAD(P)-dependent dehydrogenase (short-subunit alcohol dehydrogenase family)
MQETVDTRFDRDSTAEAVAAGIDLAGKLAVVTGASAGIGRETARVLAKAGADVFITGRDRAALGDAKAALSDAGGGSVHAETIDLMDPDSVARCADAILALGRPVDILINNAGIMAAPLARSALGIESHLATNYLGHAQLVSLLAPALKAAGKARLISLSSTGHHWSPVIFDDLNFERRPYGKFQAYGQSKTGDCLLAVKASAHLLSQGVTVLTVHPGLIVSTNLGRYLTPEDLHWLQTNQGGASNASIHFKSIESGAATSVWAATAEALEGAGPLYLEDCHVAPIVDEPNYFNGVMRAALDPADADRLWAEAERMLGMKLPL